MAQTPKSVQIHSFQVGFGDCFLLSFIYGKEKKDNRYVLVDFGTTELPKYSTGQGPKVADHMAQVANKISELCGGQLTAVVATHRHADHISGFSTDDPSGDIIRGLKPKLVLQPWTEDPAAAVNARRSSGSSRSKKTFVAGLSAMHQVAEAAATLAATKPAWMSATIQKELSFIGQDNIKNRSAVENLVAMGKARGSRAVYARHGDASGLDELLPGVKVRVLGPPDLTQTEAIRSMRKTDPDQFWHLIVGTPAFHSGPAVRGKSDLPAGNANVPSEYRWFCDRLDKIQGEQLLQIVRALDDQMNNTSLILLFEVLGKKLLFPGDAQIENWSYALQDAPDAKKVRTLLADVDVYKVGHHGSLNATPKTLLWEGFKKKGKLGSKRMKAILSTMPGKHGKPANQSEVPRRPLLKALKDETDLSNTNDLKFTKASTDYCGEPIEITRNS